jgi:hypothetical protein
MKLKNLPLVIESNKRRINHKNDKSLVKDKKRNPLKDKLVRKEFLLDKSKKILLKGIKFKSMIKIW